MDSRVSLDGKFFRLGKERFLARGFSYGPFAPDAAGGTFGSPERAVADLALIRAAGANVLRIYHVPPRWFLDLAAAAGLRLFVDVPWSKHLCFLESSRSRAAARDAVAAAARACRGHPALFAYNVVNEIPAEIVRWSGPHAVNRFLEELIDVAHQADPETLATFTSYPPTEFLAPRGQDFVCFNVYLHERAAWQHYLARLQTLAGGRPLVLGEFGMDSQREGLDRQRDFLSGHIEAAFDAGLAGAIVFGFTDDWHTGGAQVEDWSFGVTDRSRRPKPAFAAVQEAFRSVPGWSRIAAWPRVSVVVASYNGASTLPECLESLTRLDYPNFEVILVDDGSTDDTAAVVGRFPGVRYLPQAHGGLSVARNTGMAAASGSVVAFTDADCRADRDWLRYLVRDLLASPFQGMGGHNFLPPEDSWVSAAVMASPGGPAHVMLDDREAEHIPGCNMVFYRSALLDIGGFDPVFECAGDDVDVCWRLQDRGYRLGFSPAGFVWHHRRTSIGAYLRQQAGYGRAESMLAHKHPERFNFFGGGIWRGRIYARVATGRRWMIYHGVFGSGFFQKLYTAEAPAWALLPTSINFHLFVTLPLAAVASAFPVLWPLPVGSILLSLASATLAAAQAELPIARRHPLSRPLIAWLHLLQPVVRGWHRYNLPHPRALRPGPRSGQTASTRRLPRGRSLQFWAEHGLDRYAFLQAIADRLRGERWSFRTDSGWTAFDLEVVSGGWNGVRLTTVTEDLGGGRRTYRCRLQSRWTPGARLLLGGTAAAAALVVPRLAHAAPWTWLLLLLPALLAWLVVQKQRQLRSALAELVSEVARDHGLAEIPAASAANTAPSAAAPSRTPEPRPAAGLASNPARVSLER